jgi:putative heme iron utilization protein
LTEARHAALGVIDPQTGAPMVSRIAFSVLSGQPHTLVSDLSQHADALRANPAASVLVGEPGQKGDPLTHPRLTLQVRAEAADKAALKEAWLAACPKAGLYYDFTDFNLLRLAPTSALLNGGFGKAYRLDPEAIRTALA